MSRAAVVVVVLAIATTVVGGPSSRAAQRTRVVIARPVAAERTPEAASVAPTRKRKHKPPADAGFEDPLATLPSGVPRAPALVATGLSSNPVFPPDAVGEVGPTHFVQMVNGRRGSEVGIFAKDGTPVARFVLSSLAPNGHPCRNGLTDPIPIFDQFAQRWLLTEIPVPLRDRFGLCVFVSSGVDPATSTYTVTFIDTPHFPDFHKWGVWPDAYYVGANEFVARKQSPAVYAIDRAALLEGRPVSIVRRPLPRLKGFNFNPIQPVDLDGTATPPPGAPGIFVRHRDDESHDVPVVGTDSLELFELTPDFANPDASSIIGPIAISVAEFSSDLCGLVSFKCIVQPGTKRRLDPIREPVMHRALLRTFADHQSLVGTFSTDIDGNNTAGVRWFELRRPASAAQGGWTLFQEGTVGAVGASRWLGSIAMNGKGEIALGYSLSSPTTFPSIVFTGRRAADDPGLMTQGESILAAGTNAQKLLDRWGDYSAMSVDPSDDTTFWFTSEISGPGSDWQTKFGSFALG